MFNYVCYNIKKLINVKKVHYFFRENLTPDYQDIHESHDFWEALYIVKGEVLAYCGDAVHNMKAGDILFKKPNDIHHIEVLTNTTANFFSFECDSKAMEIFDNLKLPLPIHLKKLINNLYDEGTKVFDSNTTINGKVYLTKKEDMPIGGQQLYSLYLEMLLIQIIRIKNEESNTTIFATKENFYKRIVDEMVEYLRSCIYTNFSLDELCTHMNYGRTFLCSKFKEINNCTLTQYYNMLKINEAKKLISENNYSLAQISNMLNFDNQYYFSRVFKKIASVSPSEYKKQCKFCNSSDQY